MAHGDIEYGKHLADYVAKELVGWRITKAIVATDGEDFGFVVRKGGQSRAVWVMCDPEGNGPGFLDIE